MIASKNCIIAMVGFNRRYSKHGLKIKSLLEKTTAPKSLVMTINSGDIDKNHWIQDRYKGGRRIIGEICHFVDFARFLIGSEITNWSKESIGFGNEDSYVISLKFSDGSVASINYFSNGNKSHSKEQLKIFCEGAILFLDNFRVLKGYGWPGFSSSYLFRQDKGQRSVSKIS